MHNLQAINGIITKTILKKLIFRRPSMNLIITGKLFPNLAPSLTKQRHPDFRHKMPDLPTTIAPREHLLINPLFTQNL